MTDEQIEQLVQFITEQQAITSRALAELSLDRTAQSADIARLVEVTEKHSAELARNSTDLEELKDRLKLVIRVVELQAKLQDGNQEQFKQVQEQFKQQQARTDAQIAALASRIEEVAGLIEQSFKRSRNGDTN